MAATRLEKTAAAAGFIAEVATHCTARPPGRKAGLSDAAVSFLFTTWDGGGGIFRADGTRWPIILRPKPATFVNILYARKLGRITGVLNEIHALGRNMPLRMDMQDARKFGDGEAANPLHPLLAYNRRPSARNVVLWPLPGYHTIGQKHFAQPAVSDSISYLDKQDRVGWRGRPSGRANYPTTGRGPPGRSSGLILQDLLSQTSSRSQDALLEELRGLPRFRVIEQFTGQPDFDVAFTPPSKFSELASHPAFSRYCDAVRPRSWFHQFRYVLCLSGHDTGSNFFDIASSNSLMLKEEDGWELFYTASFRPWEHYVPLAAGAGDVAEKLDWVRAHPKECSEIVKRCQATAARFADMDLRKAILHAVLDSLEG